MSEKAMGNKMERLAAQETISRVVENQLKSNNPPETTEVFNRLRKEGFSETDAKRLIACALVSEISDSLKEDEPFNQERFVNALNRLPALPWE